MPITIVELHHHAVRVAPREIDATRRFYTDLLGLEVDPERPEIPGLPGAWLYVGRGPHTAQLHLMGIDDAAAGDRAAIDPTRPHVAFAVEDIHAAQAELERQGIAHWAIPGAVGPNSEQIFLLDPCGNVIELHQVGHCRCNKAALRST